MAGDPPHSIERFEVRCGVDTADNQPFVELVDHLAVQEITMDLETALLKAAEINAAVVSLLAAMRKQAHAKQRGIVTVNGQPV